MKVSVLGEIAIDKAIFVRESKQSFRWSIESQVERIGGSGANVAVTYKILGCIVDFFTGLSTNPTHRSIYQQLERVGINILGIASGTLSEIFDFYFPDENRTTVAIYPGDVLIRTTISEDTNKKQADILHVTPISIKTAHQAHQLWEAKMKAISPAAEFSGINQKLFLDLIKGYNVLTLDINEAYNYTNLDSLDELIDWFSSVKGLVTVITRGNLGSFAILDNKVFECPIANLPLPIIDTMGCGDVFAASFVYSLFDSQNIYGSLRQASLNAACMASIEGMWPGILRNKALFYKDNHNGVDK